MKRNLLTLCFISVLALATSYAQTMQIYHGAVSNLTATFTLTWYDNGKVTGSYLLPLFA